MILNKIKQTIKTLSNKSTNLRAAGDSWKNPEIPGAQLKIVDKELEMLRRGNPPSVFTVAAEALNAIPGRNKLTLLEIGCASGYYSEVISTLVGERFNYSGSDYSDAMIATAEGRYPNAKFLKLDIRHIELPDKAYDVVLSGAVLVHVKEWEMAIRELARIARLYLILHRTPVSDDKSYRIEKRIYADVPVFYNTFNKDEFMHIVLGCGFRKIFEKNIYSNEIKGSGSMTYVFERLE
jgi:2-polyprenyl-3-methyl-5-hydroxy-6-metoxy-1,4-benzoquinol methylase